MTVIRPNSVSGITSITAQANEINFFRSNGTLAGLQLNGVNFNTTTGISTFNNLDVGGVLTYQDVTNVDSVGIITARSNIDCNGDLDVDGHTNLDNVNIAGVTTSTGNIYADNYFGNGGLTLNNNGNPSINLTSTSTTGSSRINFGDPDSNAVGKIHYVHDGDYFKFDTAYNERLRITSAGNLGIGTVTPAALTHIYDATDTTSATEQFRISGGNRTADTFETGFRFFTQSPSANGNRYVSFTSNGNTGLIIQPHETSSGNAAVDRVISLCPSGGSVNIGDNSTQTSRRLAVNGSALFKATEADIWLESTGPNAVWRILGSTGGNTHQFRIYDNTNAADRFVIDSNGRVIIGDTSTTNASANADDLVISGSGQKGITIHSSNSSYSNIYFSDGSGSNHYVGYCQYNHNNNHLNLGAGGAQRVMIYDKDGASGTTKAVLQVGGSAGNNHYNNYQNASITFGGGNDIENYFIGTRMENYGGNYTKLDLRWHTGIRMGAQQIYGGIRFYNDEDLDTLKFSIMTGGDNVETHTTFRPGLNNNYNCGTSGRRWAQIWYYNANSTSDRNEKNTIKESDLGLDFICKLKPVSYKWNQREGENADTKTHYGLISQDVEEAVIGSKKTLDDFGAIVKPEGDDPMGLSYHEFISPLVKAIQEQQEQIKILQENISALKSQINN